MSDGPAVARWATSGEPPDACTAARHSGSSLTASAPETSTRFPRWILRAWIPGCAVSSTAHGYFVRGQSPNPRDPGR